MKKIYALMLMAAMAAGAMAQEFVSDGTGNVYTFNSLSQIEGTGVTMQDDGSYLVAADFTISEGDVLQMDNNAVIKMANGIRITIDGNADFAPADTAVVTRDVEGSNPKGFWMLGENGNAELKNVTFEYVGVTFGGLNSSLHADNCTFILYNGKMNSSGALAFSIIIRNCLFWHNTTSNRNKPQINLTVGGAYDVLIEDNDVIGGQFTMSGGIGLSNMVGLGHTGTNIVKNNYIADNRYKVEDPEAEDYNPGNNTFLNNGFDGTYCDLYNNGTATIYAQGNTWNVAVQDEESIEQVIYHQVDDPSKGLVIFMPAHQETPSAIEEISATQGNNLYYNLMGLPSEAPTAPGIYIHNGKKILVK